MAALRDIRNKAIQKLGQMGNETSGLDVDLLLEAATGLTPLDFILEPDRQIGAQQEADFQALLGRRLLREPISQILGRKDFWTLTFKVSRHCLTPRPDSEVLIEAALKSIVDKKKPLKILDLGTGSGCLILSLLSELPHSLGTAVDISDKALDLAKENARRLGFQERCTFILSDWAQELPPGDKFDIILCNPPYIAEEEAEALAPDVRDYEPHMALFAKNNGLEEYQKLGKTLPGLMAVGGRAFLEIGHEQGLRAASIFKNGGAKNIRIIQDLAARDRCIALDF
ncbi:MAG: peptide chain release factor N(5)-glutamine methyltransferase [Emcibacter sp.]|nr:peptide chain release factor N(5)-glutamine methyltransferase [Emcibacter sp.]